MKHKIIILLFQSLILLSSLDARSQKFYGGIHAGINGSQIWGDKMSGFNKGGLLAGVFVDYPYTQNSSFTLELNYSEKGSRSEDGTSQTAGSWTLAKISYLEVPVFYNFRLSDKIDLIIGLSYGIKVAHNYIDSLGTEYPDFDFSRSSDFGISGGVNYRLSDKFKISIRGFSSLITIGKGKSNPIWARTNYGLISNVVSCSVKYYFLSPKN